MNAECPHQKACINSVCVDPCAYHQCAQQLECHVDNHQPICVHTGKSSFYLKKLKQNNFPSNQNPNKYFVAEIHEGQSFLGRDPYDCSHCSGGTCDPTTGACVKGNFDHSLSGSKVITSFNFHHFEYLEELGISRDSHLLCAQFDKISSID